MVTSREIENKQREIDEKQSEINDVTRRLELAKDRETQLSIDRYGFKLTVISLSRNRIWYFTFIF